MLSRISQYRTLGLTISGSSVFKVDSKGPLLSHTYHRLLCCTVSWQWPTLLSLVPLAAQRTKTHHTGQAELRG